jgi:glycerol dehydrogenase
MTTKVLLAPSRYVQGPDALADIADHLATFGIGNPLILVDPNARGAIQGSITRSLESKGMRHVFAEFQGECTWGEIRRVADMCRRGRHDAIISCGGGKTMDTGRAAATGKAVNAGVVPPKVIEKVGADCPCIQVPTIASTDAATARACLVYNEEGIFQTVIIAPANPLMVMADTRVIAAAPVRTLVAGMGDALSTYFEASICDRTASETHAGGLATRAALMMGRLAFDILMEYGLEARKENENGIAGPALEAVVEANILLSGVGYESGGLSAAHAIAESLTVIQDHFDPPPLHGEVVAFGTLALLWMEERNRELLDRIIGFCQSVGLPTTFAEMGLKGLADEDLGIVAAAAAKDPLIRSMPRASKKPDAEMRFYDPAEIFNGLKEADAYSRAYGGMHTR